MRENPNFRLAVAIRLSLNYLQGENGEEELINLTHELPDYFRHLIKNSDIASYRKKPVAGARSLGAASDVALDFDIYQEMRSVKKPMRIFINSNSQFSDAQIEEFIKSGDMRMLYLSRPTCGVCSALIPKIEEMIEFFPDMEARYIDLDEFPEAAGKFSVFTIPGILVFMNACQRLKTPLQMMLKVLMVY